ncbi:MAG TPA: hypothetical protein VN083_00710, partial [Vicinamibacteria bacterium]|nr:hypothetical protein [Vicinamibacteria bacterium]
QVMGLARKIAEPALRKTGLKPWNSGYDALLAARLIQDRSDLRPSPEAPLGPVARVVARTLGELRLSGVDPDGLEAGLKGAAATPEDQSRLSSLVLLFRRFHASLEGAFADPAQVLRAATDRLPRTAWLRGFEVLVVDALELDPLEEEFVLALARTIPLRLVGLELPSGLRTGSFGEWALAHGLQSVPASETILAPLEPPPLPEGLLRLRRTLFEPPSSPPCRDGSVELVTAPGESAEVKAVVRRLLREAGRGVPFEEMGVILPDPVTYAPLFTDLLERLGIPHRLHPSLPLRFGRASRALQLLFRCRGLERSAVMEFVTFAPIPFGELLGEGVTPKPAQWDALSREARIVSGLDRWIVGLRAYAASEEDAARLEADPDRRARRERRVADAEGLLRIVELLAAALELLSGTAPWPEWADRLETVLGQWIGGERDRPALEGLIQDLRGLGTFGGDVEWREVEQVLLSRLEWERLPLAPLAGGG